MTTATLPRTGRRSLIGSAVAALQARAKGGKRFRGIARAAAAARQHVLTVAALAAADLGGFQVFHHGGWFVVTASLLALDFAVTG